MKLIDKDALVAEIEKLKLCTMDEHMNFYSAEAQGEYNALSKLESFIYTLEMKEVDLKKLGEIARHLIAVKEHIEDMRLNKDEWSMLEKIGYPERFKALKGE